MVLGNSILYLLKVDNIFAVLHTRVEAEEDKMSLT